MQQVSMQEMENTSKLWRWMWNQRYLFPVLIPPAPLPLFSQVTPELLFSNLLSILSAHQMFWQEVIYPMLQEARRTGMPFDPMRLEAGCLQVCIRCKKPHRNVVFLAVKRSKFPQAVHFHTVYYSARLDLFSPKCKKVFPDELNIDFGILKNSHIMNCNLLSKG